MEKVRAAAGGPSLRQLADSPDFFEQEPVVIDLAAMPHLLIGGTTGSGKSMCVHALLASLLCTCPPDNLRLLLIGPLEVELKYYTGLPHLVGPLVSRSAQALEAFNQTIGEIERRYALLAERQARRKTLERTGLDIIDLETGKPFQLALKNFFDRRIQRAGR